MYYFDNYLLSSYYVSVIIVGILDATVKSKDVNAGGGKLAQAINT